MPLLEIKDLHVTYAGARGRPVQAVRGVALAVDRGESVGLVGESGCGKSTLAAAVMRLVPAARGRILYDGADVTALRGRDLFAYRGRAQMVFQDPYGSLNPRLSIGSALEECLSVRRIGARCERREMVARLLRDVGLEPAHAARYPHEFSGGQRQRIGIARTLAVNPEFIIADEPVSALDVSIQAQILNLLKDLQARQRFSFLFIAHDLAVVRYMCTRVYVMYLGQIMEEGKTAEVYARPAHPYTRALLDAVPDIARPRRKRSARPGSDGDPETLPVTAGGCPFYPRCPVAKSVCGQMAPEIKKTADGRFSRCHFAGEG